MTKKLSQLVSIGVWCLMLNYFLDKSTTDRQLESTAVVKAPISYSIEDIMRTAPNMQHNHPRLLVFDGHNFAVYNLNFRKQHYGLQDPWPKRSGKIIPLLVHALKELNPDRFKPGQPVFQLLFMDSDTIGSPCFNSGTCPVEEFAPILMFGSVPANETEMPTVKAFPNWFFVDCLYNHKLKGTNNCQWPEKVVAGKWEDLTPTVIWRGRDFAFLGHKTKYQFGGARAIDLRNTSSPKEVADLLMEHWDDLTPRWRGVALTAQGQMKNDTWVDVKFVGSNGVANHKRFESRGVIVTSRQRMEPPDMARYKYLVDFGGGGGTSWKGGITKLGLPGLLFHHHTDTKDWFFPEMKPWIHYVPISWDVKNLRERFEWAEGNQIQAHVIAAAATKLYHYLMSETYLRKVYKDLFEDYLGNVLEGYISSPETWEETLRTYKMQGFAVHQVAVCDDMYCRVPGWTEMPTSIALRRRVVVRQHS